jgi:thiazole biosynthesis/tRNA modification protein ThiI
MKKIILVRYGEIVLKGLNRPVFEDKLMNNIKKSLYGLGKVSIIKSQARIYIEPATEDYDYDAAIDRLIKVFGIVSVSPVWKIKTDFEEIKTHALIMMKQLLKDRGHSSLLEPQEVCHNQDSFKRGHSSLMEPREECRLTSDRGHSSLRELQEVCPFTFKVETKRGNKRFPMESPEVSAELGGHILENIPSLTVDVHNPSITIYVEVRESTYIYSKIIPSNGGLPLGTNGKALLLLSGGIDSPVAGWMMAKRGVEIEAVHFYSYPYTSERAKDKVIQLAKIMARYCSKINLHIVPFTDIQLEINGKCPQDQITIIMRRAMMAISEIIAEKTGCQALITGESMGQVASQTIQSLAVTNAAVKMPVFRPLIGMDKNEVIEIARKIDTFETSILPYEDCCTVFVAKHPKTRPKLVEIEKHETGLLLKDLIDKAIANTEVIPVNVNTSL